MDAKEIIRMGLDEYMDGLRKALDGLTSEERRFQPDPKSHHIDFTVWHMARVEDNWVQSFARRAANIWHRDGWHEKLGLPKDGSGFGYDAAQIASLPSFDIDGLMAYYNAVAQETRQYLDALTPEDLDTCPEPERRPGYSIGKMFSHVIVEESQHLGQIAYLRGMQRGLNK